MASKQLSLTNFDIEPVPPSDLKLHKGALQTVKGEPQLLPINLPAKEAIALIVQAFVPVPENVSQIVEKMQEFPKKITDISLH